MKDLGGIEPPKSFRNAEVSVPYGALEESDKLKFAAVKHIAKAPCREAERFLWFIHAATSCFLRTEERMQRQTMEAISSTRPSPSRL